MAKILTLAFARVGHAPMGLPVADRSAKSVACAAARYARAYAPAPDKASALSLRSLDSGIGCGRRA